jgi:hypothetical protein
LVGWLVGWLVGFNDGSGTVGIFSPATMPAKYFLKFSKVTSEDTS